MNKLFLTLRNRWQAKTPLIFSRIIKIAVGISTVSIAIQTALTASGASVPEWWEFIFPYFVGAGAGMATIAKLTQQYDKDNNPIRKPKKLRKLKWEHTL